jgi:hypothetical protein
MTCSRATALQTLAAFDVKLAVDDRNGALYHRPP